MSTHGIPNLKDALREAERHGCTLRHDAGEVLVSHPSWPRSQRINNRRKDAPRCLTTALRRLASAVMLLLVVGLVAGAEDEPKMPQDVVVAQEKADKAAKDIKADADAKLAKVNQDLLKVLTKAQEAATKKGDLKLALAINARAEKLQEATDLLAPPKPEAPIKTWAVGTWEVLWSGYRANVTFGNKTVSRQDGATGSVAYAQDQSITITWEKPGDGGAVWTIQPPEKGNSAMAMGRNAFGTSFKFTKQ